MLIFKFYNKFVGNKLIDISLYNLYIELKVVNTTFLGVEEIVVKTEFVGFKLLLLLLFLFFTFLSTSFLIIIYITF
jgi:hypothetical protein